MNLPRDDRPAAGVSPPCRGASSFLFACPRTRRSACEQRSWPARAEGLLPCGCAGGLRVFSTAPPCAGEKLTRIPAGHPADFPPPTRRAIGAPGRAARSCAQKQRQHQEHPTPTLLCLQGREIAGQRDLAPASGAQEARLLFRGPWAAVRRGRGGRAAGEARDDLAFSRGQEPARKARLRLTHLPGRSPASAAPGCRFLLVTSPLDKQRRSNSGAQRAHETALHDTTPELTP